MPVDIDHLTYDELVALSHRIHERRQWRVPPEMLSPIKDVKTGTTIVPGDHNCSD